MSRISIDDCIRVTQEGLKINRELERKANTAFMKKHAKGQVKANSELLKDLMKIKKQRHEQAKL
jgi:RNA polymerase-interacting CarD/CdnL/TRCF family regulator